MMHLFAHESAPALEYLVSVLMLKTDMLTPEQATTAKLLVKEHQDLQRQLLQVNSDLDDHLSRRGQGLSRVQPIARPGGSEVDRLALKNEQQRKLNDELARQLIVVDALAKTDAMRQRYNVLLTTAEKLRDENKSLENIYANQQTQILMTDRIDSEMRKAKQDHSEELTKMKEVTRQLKDAREAEVERVRHFQRVETKVEMRLKLQSNVSNSKELSVAEMEALLASKDSELGSLRDQIMALSKASTGKARAKATQDKRSRELEDLRGEAELLREKLEALEIHEQL